MADHATCPPLTPASISIARDKISRYIHRTPLLTSRTLDTIVSSPDPAAYLSDNPPDTIHSPTLNGNNINVNASKPNVPNFRLFFKCENHQKIGAFKARGAFHALSRLISELGLETVKSKGVITHSSGNHAQALALAASTFGVPAYIVMPSISTPSKIAGTKKYTKNVIFSGSTSVEREEKVREVQSQTGAILVPPYDHPDIILGQGTVGKEMSEQFVEAVREGYGDVEGVERGFDAVVAPIGGGGLLGGVATWFSDKRTRVFGAEPSFQGADDARRGLAVGKRVESVKTLTIADGLRTPVGVVNWGVVSDKKKVEGVYAVSEEEIKMAMRLVLERMKVVVEPSAAVPLAVVLFNREFRAMVVEKQLEEREEGRDGSWNVGVVFSGGNTTVKAISKLFGDDVEEKEKEREEGVVGKDGARVAENVAG
jgi:threonine dehydratase